MKKKDRHGVFYDVVAENSFYETLGDPVQEVRVNNGTATTALEQVLEQSRWTTGIIEDFGLGTVEITDSTVKEAVQGHILNAWQCDFQTRIEVTGTISQQVDLL